MNSSQSLAAHIYLNCSKMAQHRIASLEYKILEKLQLSDNTFTCPLIGVNRLSAKKAHRFTAKPGKGGIY